MSVPLPPKLYFRIGEVAGLVGVEPHVLRYWEREFRSIRPTKSAKGQRVYSRKDVEALIVVKDLLYAQGFTIAGAKKRLQRSPDVRVQPAPTASMASSASTERATDGASAAHEPAQELGELDLPHAHPERALPTPSFSLGRSAEEALLMSAASVGSASTSVARRPARAKTDTDRTRKVLISLRAEVETLLSELAENADTHARRG